MNAAAAQSAVLQPSPVFALLPAICTEKMARVHPQIGGLPSHDQLQWEVNADADDARKLACASWIRKTTAVPITIK